MIIDILKLLFLIGFIGAFGSPQISSKLIYKGDTISVYLNSLPKEFYKKNTKSFERVLSANVFGDKEICWSTEKLRQIGLQKKMFEAGKDSFFGIAICKFLNKNLNLSFQTGSY